MTPLTLIEVEPISTRSTPTFVEAARGKSGLKMTQVNSYPVSPMGILLSSLRHMRGIMIGEAAKLLNIRSSELSGLQEGRFTLSQEDWERALNAIADRKGVMSNDPPDEPGGG
jgi:hypothetical protein